MSDSGQLINTNLPVLERLTEEVPYSIPMTWSNQPGREIEMNGFFKTFVRPNIENTFWDNAPQLIPKNMNEKILVI